MGAGCRLEYQACEIEDSAVSTAAKDSKTETAAPVTNFIRNIIDADLAAGKHAQRHWSGKPGLAEQQLAGGLDLAKIRSRFPP